MRNLTFGEAMVSIILAIILIPLAVMMFHGETDNQPTTQAAVPCEFCEGACKLFHKTACETGHNAPDYYYYTYKCEKCGNEFTIEIIQE